jgi:hypothetical protein
VQWFNHRLKTGDPVVYTSSGGKNKDVGGLVSGTTYYAIVVDANTIKLAASAANATGGIAVDLTSKGTGTGHALSPVWDGLKILGTDKTHAAAPGEDKAADKYDPKDSANFPANFFDDTIIVDSVPSGTVYGSIPSFGAQGLGRLQIFGDKGNDTLVNNTDIASLLVGGEGRDLLAGGTHLSKQGASGSIDPNAIDDVLVGGLGKDWLWGNIGSDVHFPDYEYTPPVNPAAPAPYGSFAVVNNKKGESGDKVDGDRAYNDGNDSVSLKKVKPGVDKLAYSGSDTLSRIEKWSGSGGKLTLPMWLMAGNGRLNKVALAALENRILASGLVKPFPPCPLPPAASPRAEAAAPATTSSSQTTAKSSAVYGPQPEFASALMSVLADDFPTTLFGRDKRK